MGQDENMAGKTDCTAWTSINEISHLVDNLKDTPPRMARCAWSNLLHNC
jgi:hypothetical protein